MPITITPNTVVPAIGPGIQFQLHSDHNDFIPIPTLWTASIFSDSDRTKFVWIESVSGGLPSEGASMQLMSTHQKQQVFTTTVIQPGTNVFLDLKLQDANHTVVDESVTQLPWTNDGLPFQIFQLDSQRAAGGLTTTQAQQLTDTERRTQVIGEPTDLAIQTPTGLVQTTLGQIFSRSTLDRLTLEEVTNGDTCTPVRTSISGWYVGVVVRVTVIDPELVPRTPDAQWYFPDLAVLRVFRGADLEYRRGIHTPTFMVEKPWQWGWSILNESDVLGVPPDITVAVDWRANCCGRVFLQLLP